MFTHLAARSSYSLRDGVMRPRELAVATAERGMNAIGIADRDGLYGAVRLAQACEVVGVKLIIGADLALNPAEQRTGWEDLRARDTRRKGPGSGAAWLEGDTARVTLIARSQHGYANLCRTISDAHLDGDRGTPQLSWEQLGRRPDGWFVLLGDASPVARLLDAGRPSAAEEEARHWMDLVGPSSVLVGVTHHLAPGDDQRARARFALADSLGLRAVAHQAPRYLDPSGARIADVVDAVRQQVPVRSVAQQRGHRRNAEGYFKTPEEMARVFAERPDALASTAWVAEQCAVDLGLGQLRVPDFVATADAQAELRGRCEAGVNERYPRVTEQHRELLERELAMVARLGLASYFLTVAEIVERIREKGIMAACRGSAAGSILTYALRISDVDPVAHDLAFERFMNPYRDELPDIDIDVESARREDIYRDLLDRYGEDRVACVCMVETFKARMAIREVGKALGMPAGEVDYLAKSFPRVRAGDVRAAMEHLPELRGLNINRADLALLFDVVERLDSFPRHIALHPSGVLLADATLRDLVPVERSANGFAMAQFDKDDVEALGLCKLDVLAVRMLSSMAHAKEEIQRTRGVELNFDHVPWDDPDTYELIRSTRTLGMFQIESPGQRELVGKFQPEHLGDLVVDISLFRPGPVKGDMVGPFLQRRHRAQAAGGGSASEEQSRVVYPHPILERALSDTYGVIVYHEQVMRCVAAVTGCDLATADLVRRRLGDPDELDGLRTWILAGAKQRGLDDKVAESLWHALSQFASFGFCKAHAAAFAVPTYRSAWLKTHYLPEFVAGLLTHDPGMYPRRLLLDDARQFGIAVLPLDINRSARDYRVERLPTDEALTLLGLGEVVEKRHTTARWLKDGANSGDGSQPPREGPGFPSGFDKGGDPQDPAWRFGIRLALQDVAGIDDRMIDSVLAARPFVSVADVRRRAALSGPVAEALTHAGAFDEIGGVGGLQEGGAARTRRDLLLEVTERWSGVRRHQPTDPAAPEQLGLLAAEDAPGLGEYRSSERVRAELEVLGIDASQHVISFYDTLLDAIGVTRATDLLDARNGQRVRVAGVKVATQTPPVKSGQRIIFLSLDDGTGVSDSTFFESVHDRCAWTVFHTWLVVVEGTVHRTGRRGVSINAEVVWDLRRLMRAWREGWLADALEENRAVIRSRPAQDAGRDFGDGAPAGIAGAAGRSGLVPDRGGSLARAPGLRPDVGSPSRVGPNGTTWADPTGRNGNIADQDLYQLPITDPRHPRHVAAAEEEDTPRKLWHSSSGSAGG